MTCDSIVLLFIKAPVKGRVKSRLAAAIGQDHALNLYKNFVLDVLNALQKSVYPVRICFYPATMRAAVADWIGGAHQYMAQNGNDLGERMEHAFSRVFSEGFTRAVIIGGDIPDLKGVLIHEAFQSLKTNDVVLGPAADGGYYLIGFNKDSFLSQPFHEIMWSTDSVFRDTITILQSASRRIHLLPSWEDVDSLADLKSLVKRNKHSEFSRSRTMEYLDKHERELFS